MAILGEESITLRRFGAITRGTDGRGVLPTPTDSTILASVQPATGRDMATLPEGERTTDGIRFYTVAEVRTADQHLQTPADRVVVDGLVYEVRQVKRERAVIPHYRCIAVRLLEGGAKGAP